jgi:predicted phage terminase large subunit-like protein
MAKAQFAAWRPNAVLIEDKASGQSLIQALQRNTSIPIIPVNPQNDGDKVVRALAVTPLHEAGLIYLPGFYEDDDGRMRLDAPPWVTEMVDRFANFPNGNFKDEIDAASQALAYLRDFAAVGEIQSAVTRVTGAKLLGFRQLVGGSGVRM